MNSIRYSSSFNCLILERDDHPAPLHLLNNAEDMARLFRILTHWADLDRPDVKRAEARLSPRAIEELMRTWQPKKELPFDLEV